ncbi:uncharacterized protein AAG666_008239 [Megaptera novaeangliae]
MGLSQGHTRRHRQNGNQKDKMSPLCFPFISPHRWGAAERADQQSDKKDREKQSKEAGLFLSEVGTQRPPAAVLTAAAACGPYGRGRLYSRRGDAGRDGDELTYGLTLTVRGSDKETHLRFGTRNWGARRRASCRPRGPGRPPGPPASPRKVPEARARPSRAPGRSGGGARADVSLGRDWKIAQGAGRGDVGRPGRAVAVVAAAAAAAAAGATAPGQQRQRQRRRRRRPGSNGSGSGSPEQGERAAVAAARGRAAPGASRPSLALGPSALLRPLLLTALTGSRQRAAGEGGAVGGGVTDGHGEGKTGAVVHEGDAVLHSAVTGREGNSFDQPSGREKKTLRGSSGEEALQKARADTPTPPSVSAGHSWRDQPRNRGRKRPEVTGPRPEPVSRSPFTHHQTIFLTWAAAANRPLRWARLALGYLAWLGPRGSPGRATQMGEALTLAATCMDPENTMLSERSQTQKDTQGVTLLRGNVQNSLQSLEDIHFCCLHAQCVGFDDGS